MANLPIFAVGSYNSIQPAIDSGVLSYPAYIITTDTQHENRLVFLDKDLSLRIINGGETIGERQVVRVAELPDVGDGDVNVLYIYKNIVYVFTGEEYKPMYVDYSDEFDSISGQLSDIDDALAEITDEIENLSRAVFIDLDDKYVNTTAVVSSVDEMTAALADQDISEIILNNDLLYEGDTGIVLDDGSSKTIELSGWNITISNSDPGADVVAVRVLNGSILDISDNENKSVIGAGDSGSSNTAIEVSSDSTINVFGGTYTCGSQSEYATSTVAYGESGDINIYGGHFENTTFNGLGGSCMVLNISDNSGSHIVCYGGEFVDQDPSYGDDMDISTGSTFVADGYTVETSTYNDTHKLYTVVEED